MCVTFTDRRPEEHGRNRGLHPSGSAIDRAGSDCLSPPYAPARLVFVGVVQLPLQVADQHRRPATQGAPGFA